MLYILICTVILMAASAVFEIMALFKWRKKNKSVPEVQNACTDLISWEQIDELSAEDKSKMVEITDTSVLSQVKSAAPKLFKAGTATNKAVSAGQAVAYQATLPAKTSLVGQVNIAALTQTTALAVNAGLAVYSLAAMVVGQYFMARIDAELNRISSGLDRISDFQNNEFKSRVLALIAQVKKLACFQSEILANEEIRSSELNALNGLENECMQLLGQANFTVSDYAAKQVNFDIYSEEVLRAQNWYGYQALLMDVLKQIADLKYALNLGKLSRDNCTALIEPYKKQTSEAQQKLREWHKQTTERLGIDIQSSKRKRSGFDKIIHWLPGKFNSEKNFKAIDENLSDMIKEQSEGNISDSIATADPFNSEVKLIASEGKIYYLPPEAV